MRQLSRAFAVLTIGLATLVLPVQSASADPSPTCHLFALATATGTGMAHAEGARAEQCIDSATLTTRLRQDISFFPDKNLMTRTASGKDIFINFNWQCPNFGAGITVFAESSSSLGGSVQSRRVVVQGCNT